MATLIVMIHIVASVCLILIVMLQAGKGAGLGGLLGGGSSDSLVSASGGLDFIKKLTIALAVTFMVTSMSLTIITMRKRTATIVKEAPAPKTAESQTPAAPLSSEEAPAEKK